MLVIETEQITEHVRLHAHTAQTRKPYALDSFCSSSTAAGMRTDAVTHPEYHAYSFEAQNIMSMLQRLWLSAV